MGTTRVETPQARGTVGLAWRDVTPPVGIYHRMWGAASHERAESVHRPLRATALWLEPEGGAARAVVALDHCILDGSEMARIAATAGAATGLAADRVQVTLSHTHGAGLMLRSRASLPGGDLIGPYLDAVAVRAGEALAAARAAAAPATLLFARARCDLAATRDYWDASAGRFVCGYDPDAPADDTVLVARIVADTRLTLGAIVQYACHPTTLAWENRAISPDYVGALRETVEREIGGPCLFLQGASGDLGPREGFVGDAEVADRNGRQLGYAALSALTATPPPGTRFVYRGPVVSGAVLGTWAHERREPAAGWREEAWAEPLPYRVDLADLDTTLREEAEWREREGDARARGDEAAARDARACVEQRTRQINRLRTLPPGKTFPCPIRVWRWGESLWVWAPGEHYQTLQTSLRARFPKWAVLVTTLTGDWTPGYVPPARAYGYGIYQESIAAVAPGAAETLIESIARRLSALVGENEKGPHAG